MKHTKAKNRASVRRSSVSRLCLIVLCFSFPLSDFSQSAGHGAAYPATAFLSAEGTIQAQTEPLTLRTSSALVIVPTTVRHPGGEFIQDLAAKDFALTDNGVTQRVISEVDSSAGLAIAVVMQTGSGAPKYFQKYRTLAAVLGTLSNTPSLKAALVTFDSRPEQIWNFPSRTDGLQGALEQQSSGDDGAAILDAVEQGISLLEGQPKNFRRLLLLISQPQDAGSVVVPAEIVRRLGESNTAVYSVTFPQERVPAGSRQSHSTNIEQMPGLPVEPSIPPEILKQLGEDTASELASLSGGQHLFLKNEGELKRTLSSLQDDLSKAYVLSFQPTAPTPGFHAIGVQVDKRLGRLSVQGRTAYWR